MFVPLSKLDLKLYLQSYRPLASSSSMMRAMASRRSRDSSTGSSTGSNDWNHGSSPSMKKSNQGLVELESSNELIATEAFDLMVTCLHIRSQSLHTFFNLPSLPDFVIETILGKVFWV